ncbi:unnamed protein product [Brassica napus]|uniref:(rape) hypothetical protein n=1 Tax=Brassica napus TaxID=3708 RepID=A0A816YK34_BRANA|nr:unnamed protein product [Brassica napus]
MANLQGKIAAFFWEFRERLFFLSEHEFGSLLLMKFCARISDLNLEEPIIQLLADHIADLERMKMTLLNGICSLFRTLNVRQLEPLMRLIDFNIINLSSDPRSLANFESMVQIARYDVQMCLIDMIRPCVLDIARDKNGNNALQSLIILHNGASDFLVNTMANNITSLSHHPYASFVIQKCLHLGSKRNVLFIIFELSTTGLLSLLYQRFGNYVLQSVVRRLSVLNAEQCRELISEILSRRNELETHDSARKVVKTCDYVLKKM